MKSAKYSNNKININEELVNSIIRVAYDDAGFWERRKILNLARTDKDVRTMLDSYIETANSVHTLEPEDCPNDLVDAALNKVKVGKGNQPSFLFDIYNALFAKPLVSALSLAVLIAVITTSIFLNTRQDLEGYQIADIEAANRDAKYAFAIVNKVFSSTSKSLKDDILLNKVGRPINKGIKTVNKLFTDKEKKNEN